MENTSHKIVFGDFQTPLALARKVCHCLARKGLEPATVLEPTCGEGAFLQASLETFAHLQYVFDADIHPNYVEKTRRRLRAWKVPFEIQQADFFTVPWQDIVERLPEPILVIGNPPWVTNSELGIYNINNLPPKQNRDNFAGIHALTGKSNFDISEWILRRCVECLTNKHAIIAMLCKTAVARKVLKYAFQQELPVASAEVYLLDAQKVFGISVSACLLFLELAPKGRSKEWRVFSSLDGERLERICGLRDNLIIADISTYEKWQHLRAKCPSGWRSGIKHDCAGVFELRTHEGRFINKLGETVDIEPEHLFPLLKSSDLANHKEPSRWLFIPHQSLADDPVQLSISAPKAWNYLLAHAHLLDARKSSIYRLRPCFSLFGLGPYSFTPWKVAISGLYKKLHFVPVSPHDNRPVVFDDTCYFFPCDTEAECRTLHTLLQSEPAWEFFSSLIFWDEKRPITAELLNLLDLYALAQHVTDGDERLIAKLVERQRACRQKPSDDSLQASLFEFEEEALPGFRS